MQAYLLPATDDAVLIARKNVVHFKIKGKVQEKVIVCNSPGRWVISGGEVDLNESAVAASLREFEEETGVNLITTKAIDGDGLPKALAVDALHYIAGYKIRSDAAKPLLEMVNTNIDKSATVDDELFRAEWATPAIAIAAFPWDEKQNDGWLKGQIEGAKKALAELLKKMGIDDKTPVESRDVIVGRRFPHGYYTAENLIAALEQFILKKVKTDDGGWFVDAVTVWQNRGK